MAKIGIMGGTFDPPHIAHLLLAESAYEQLKLDYVLFIAGGNPPHKSEKKITDAFLRNKMLEVAIFDNDHFKISDYEVRKEEFSYTADTLEYLKQKNDDELFFILGEDSLAYLDKWYKPEKIVKYATIAVYPRGKESDVEKEVLRIKQILNAEIKILNAPILDISSSKIRELVSQNKSIRYMVPDKVAEIIKKERLYVQE